MSIWNHAYDLIDFDFVELLRFASSVLRLPRPHFASLKLRESEEGSEENQFTPPSPSRSRFGRARLGLG